MDSISLVVLAIALSLDSLSVGLLYGARGIKIPIAALVIVSLATAALLSLAMAGGHVLSQFLSPNLAERLGAFILAGVGAWITYQTWRSRGAPQAEGKPAPRSRTHGTSRHIPAPLAGGSPVEGGNLRVLRVRIGSLSVVVAILREPGKADLDGSGHINPGEALLLGIALALDSVAAGLGAAMAGFSPIGLPLAAGVGAFGLLLLGSRGASLLPFRLQGRWAVLHGVVLMALGLYRMVL